MPFGLAYGAIAGERMVPWQVSLMSLTVFAGTAQFIAASMINAGAAYWTVWITGVLINLRMVLMSAALSPYLHRVPRRRQWLIGHLLTDESFAVTISEFEGGAADPFFPIGSGLAIFVAWQISTLVGVFVGARIPAGFGLEFALPATLICLLFLLVRGRDMAIVAGLSAGLALALRPLVPDAWTTLAATILAATLGVALTRWRSRF
ncbi:MAG: AzlC family ABC transporter permease [Anaerolineae bacterium]|nr:AzlC family ABC transporter permease [Anaerolineae bacterium]